MSTPYNSVDVALRAPLLSFCISLGITPEIADDIVQETLISVWSAKLTDGCEVTDAQLKRYAIVALKNRIVDYYRKRQTELKAVNGSVRAEAIFEATSRATDRAYGEIEAAVQKLPSEMKKLWRIYEALTRRNNALPTSDQLSKALGVSESTARRHVVQMIEYVRTLLNAAH